MNNSTPSQLNNQLFLVVLCVVALCVVALFLKAYEVNNWPGFWFSLTHVAVVGLGTWLALREVR